MMWANLRMAAEQLTAHKARSALTALGIVIAVASTISVVSVIDGLTGYVATFLRGFGTNAIWVWPERPEGDAGRAFSRIELDSGDVEAITRDCPALRRVSPLIRRPSAALRLGRREVAVPLEGVAAEYPAIRNYEIAEGRPFAAVDEDQAHRVCLVGRDVPRKLGAEPSDLLDRSLLIDGHRFRVVGLLAAKGSFFGISQDDLILIPHTAALALYPEMTRLQAVAAQARSEAVVPEAKAQVIAALRRRHNLEPGQPPDFQVRTQDEVLTIFNTMSLAATVALGTLVGISLLVGGIGIMNVMLVGVTERTREIGLRKAVGARRRDVLLQFLTEAVVLSLLGGAVGIALGYAVGALASLHPRMIRVVVPGWAVTLGFGISAGTGIVFGLLPAAKAALLNPIDALRHE